MISTIKKLLASYTARDFFWVTLANIIIVIFGFIFTVIVARDLGPTHYGTFATITALILILSDLGDLGIGGGLSRFLPPLFQAKDFTNANKIIKTTFIIQLATGFITAFILIAFAEFVSKGLFHTNSSTYIQLVRLSAFGVVGFIIFNFINSIISANEQFKKTFLISLFYTIPKTIILFFLLGYALLNTNTVLFVFILGSIFGILGGVRFVNLDFIKSKGYYPLKKILNFSIFLAINKLFVTLFSRLDVVMLAALSNTYEVGLYSAASRVSFIYPLIGGSLGTVIAPKYSKLSIKDAYSYTKKVYLLLSLIILSIFFVCLISSFIIRFVYTSTYNEAGNILQLLLLTTVPFLLTIPLNNLLTYTYKKPQIVAFSSLIQLVTIFILNSILIPQYGRYGPIFSIGISSLVAMVISIVALIFLSSNE